MYSGNLIRYTLYLIIKIERTSRIFQKKFISRFIAYNGGEDIDERNVFLAQKARFVWIYSRIKRRSKVHKMKFNDTESLFLS